MDPIGPARPTPRDYDRLALAGLSSILDVLDAARAPDSASAARIVERAAAKVGAALSGTPPATEVREGCSRP